MNQEVKLGPDQGVGNALRCPRCGGAYLRYVLVTVYDRTEGLEDAPLLQRTTVGNKAVLIEQVSNAGSGNPSDR